MPTNKGAGFTLIELIIVIVILGVLAVTAAPLFLNFSNDARAATLQGLKGAVDSSISLVFYKCQLDPVCDIRLPADNSNQTQVCAKRSCAAGEYINTHFGYPNATAAGIDRALDLSGFVVTGSTGTQRNFRPAGVETSNNNCRLRYIRAAAVNTPPTVEVFSSNC
ncbi:prepilin-type N-terminal cleavage/methylation domain-containing protein [Arsukibacterium sp.]|uniref:prepilin-type N-terminal cleavage/methylation domain-containing protein n=1 Tax=Arsukibacterium sp. TaxID=1977258 RepID=UPI002FD8D8E8